MLSYFTSQYFQIALLVLCKIVPDPGNEHRKEGWKVRRLMTEFARAARRPHWPREAAMRELFAAAGIENPTADGSI